jgi:hypothetical protein
MVIVARVGFQGRQRGIVAHLAQIAAAEGISQRTVSTYLKMTVDNTLSKG